MNTTTRSVQQRLRLVGLALHVLLRRKPLGVRMRDQCWGAVATEWARRRNATTADFFGLSFSTFKEHIKGNKEYDPHVRNRRMAWRTLLLAIQPRREPICSRTPTRAYKLALPARLQM